MTQQQLGTQGEDPFVAAVEGIPMDGQFRRRTGARNLLARHLIQGVLRVVDVFLGGETGGDRRLGEADIEDARGVLDLGDRIAVQRADPDDRFAQQFLGLCCVVFWKNHRQVGMVLNSAITAIP